LEATLEALGATPKQRALALSRIEAPRALRRLNTSAEPSGMGAPPSAGDLLRALRLRGGWTQEQIAQQMGVGQNTVARWERRERLPSTEQMQALCFALRAREEEVVALTAGRFAQMPEALPQDLQVVRICLDELLYAPRAELVELRFLLLERGLWQQAVQEERALSLLARAYAAHAHYLSNYRRWEEVRTLTQRTLALTHQEDSPPDYTLRAVLHLAAAEVYGGNRLAPERGFSRLKAWLSRSQEADYTAWMLSDMGKYLAMTGQREAGIMLAARAVMLSQEERDMRQIDHGRLLLAEGHPQAALDHLPGLSEHARNRFAPEALIRVEAHLQLDQPRVAHDYLQRVYGVMETEGMNYLRAQADALAKRF